MNRITVGAWYEAKVWRRQPNTVQFEATNITFKVQVINPRNRKLSQPMQGLLTRDVDMTLRGFCGDITEKDKLELMGKQYTIMSITNDMMSPLAMGGGRFNPAYLEEKVAKIISVK